MAGVGVTSMAETGVLLDSRPAGRWRRRSPGTTVGGRRRRPGSAPTSAPSSSPPRTGLPVRPLWSIAKYAWLRAMPEELAGAVRWLGVAEWVVHGLGGEQVAAVAGLPDRPARP